MASSEIQLCFHWVMQESHMTIKLTSSHMSGRHKTELGAITRAHCTDTSCKCNPNAGRDMASSDIQICFHWMVQESQMAIKREEGRREGGMEEGGG
jgi:hypothetical protein